MTAPSSTPGPCLPTGYRSRPARLDDVAPVHRLITACERALHGRAETDPGGVAADLSLPGFDPRRDALLVEDEAGEVAGWAWTRGRRATVDVHPAHCGRGLGAALLGWAEEHARASGTDRLAQTVPDGNAAAVALLRSRGYGRLVSEWLLEYVAAAGEPVVPPAPSGVTVRRFRPGDAHAAHRLAEDAFDEWQPRRKPYEEWALRTVERDAFEPEASPVAFVGDEMVGVVLSLDVPDAGEGYVQVVAVRSDHRRRGLARNLLHETFRDFHRLGRRAVTLGTHSDTGALSLYERLGMTVRRSSTVYSRPLA